MLEVSVVAGGVGAGCAAGLEAGREVVELARVVVGLAVLDALVAAGLVAVAFEEVVVDLVAVLVEVLVWAKAVVVSPVVKSRSVKVILMQSGKI